MPFYDNDRRRNALLDSPLELLEPIYTRYAARKPIAICEYGASHMAATDRVRRNDFAIAKMSQLYSALPRLYPRVKMINWFSANNLVHARPGRQLNNYNVTEQSAVLETYRRLISAPHFLGEIPEAILEKRPSSGSNHAPSTPAYMPLRSGELLPQQAHLSIWVKSIVASPFVYLALDKTVLYAAQQGGVHDIRLDLKEFAGTQRTLTVYIYDDHKRFVTSQSFKVSIESTPR